MSSIDSRILKEKDETEGKDNHIQREAKSILKSPKEKINRSTSCTWYYRIKATTKLFTSTIATFKVPTKVRVYSTNEVLYSVHGTCKLIITGRPIFKVQSTKPKYSRLKYSV